MRVIKKAAAVLISFCIALSGFPLLAGELDVQAITYKTALKVTSVGKTTVKLKWSKVKKPGTGYAVFRNGKLVKRLSKYKTTFKDSKLKTGKTYKYQLKTYTKKKVKKWYNKKTKKWVRKKPARKNRGRSKKVTVYKYKTVSKAIKATPHKPTPKYSYKLYLVNPNKQLVDGTFNSDALLYLKTNNPKPSTIGIDGFMQTEVYSISPQKNVKEINLRFGIGATSVVGLSDLNSNNETQYDSSGNRICTDAFKVPGGYFLIDESSGSGETDITIREKVSGKWIKACSIKYKRLDAKKMFEGYAEHLASSYFGSDYSFSWEELSKLTGDMQAAATYPHMIYPGKSYSDDEYVMCPLQAYDTPWGDTHVMDSALSPALLALVLDHFSGVTYVSSAKNHGNEYHAYLDITYNGETREIMGFCPEPQPYKAQKLILP